MARHPKSGPALQRRCKLFDAANSSKLQALRRCKPFGGAQPPKSHGGRPDLVAWLGRIAQLVEQLTLNQRVQGSSPCAPTIANHF